MARQGADCQKARERQELAEQIRNLQEKLQILESRNQQIQEKMKKQQELEVLGAKSRLIAILCKKEVAALFKLTKKIENPKFMEQLDSEDVSTEVQFPRCIHSSCCSKEISLPALHFPFYFFSVFFMHSVLP